MKKVKFLLSIAVIFTALLFCSISASALTEGDWEFQLLNDQITITGYIGEGGDVVIPDTLYGLPVTKVAFVSWNNNFENATSLTFPATVKTIGDTKYGYFGSWGSSDKLERVIIPEGAETIVRRAFANCRKLKEINFPSTLKKIESEAFSGCESLTKVNFSTGLESIGSYCFRETALVEVYLPYIKTVGINLFTDNTQLQYATIAEGYTVIPESLFSGCSSLKNVTLPSTVYEIGNFAFMDCASLESIIFPTNLYKIGQSAFHGCESLVEVVLPFGFCDLGSGAFISCKNLKGIYIPGTIRSIDGSNFIHGANNCIVYCTSDSLAAEHCQKHSISYLTDNSVNSGITVLYNGTRISFHSYGQNPAILNSRTLVPLRSIFEAMGAEVTWDDATKTAIAKRDGVEIKISIGANEIYKDGEAIAVDVPATILNDRTMVPARVIAEAFGADVKWNDTGKTVIITE